MNDVTDPAESSESIDDLASRMICIRGASDNLAEVLIMKGDKTEAHEEYDVPGHNPVRFRLMLANGVGIEVVLIFLESGVWSAGVAQLEEGCDQPNWPISFMASGYSTSIVIEIPRMVTVELVSYADGG